MMNEAGRRCILKNWLIVAAVMIPVAIIGIMDFKFAAFSSEEKLLDNGAVALFRGQRRRALYLFEQAAVYKRSAEGAVRAARVIIMTAPEKLREAQRMADLAYSYGRRDVYGELNEAALLCDVNWNFYTQKAAGITSEKLELPARFKKMQLNEGC